VTASTTSTANPKLYLMGNSGKLTPPVSQRLLDKWWVVLMLWAIAFFNYADRQRLSCSAARTRCSCRRCSPGSSDRRSRGLRPGVAARRNRRGPRQAQDSDSRRPSHLSIVCAATALSNFRHLFLFRAAEGLGETFYFPSSMSLISDYHGRNTRSRAMGLHQTSVYVGTIGGGFFAGLIGQHYGWRLSFIVFGLLGILLGVILHLCIKEPVRGAAEPDAPAVVRPLSFGSFLRLVTRTPALMCLMGAFMCANFVAVVLLSWMPKFLYDTFSMSLAMAGLTATLFVQLASMAGAPLGGFLADAWRRRSPRPHGCAGDWRPRRRAIRRGVRHHDVDWCDDSGADDVGAVQGAV
jgi:MFS family permease